MAKFERVGFIGLGTMGEPMALRLISAGTPLLVWNRTPSKCAELQAAGATVATDPAEVLARCEVVILMLTDGAATDAVLARGHHAFADRIKGRIIISMATTAPSYSKRLEADIRAEGGHYIESPVSGSRKPAEAGELIAMLAGDPAKVVSVCPLLAPMCRETLNCGAVPNALFMKLAVNVFLLTLVAGLAEAAHFAQCHGLDLHQLAKILNAGQMASDVSRIKLAKLVTQDFSIQAGISNVLENSRLTTEAARNARIASPLLDVCHALYGETKALGFDAADMISVIHAIEQRTTAGV